MKKSFLKKTISLLLVLAVCLSLTACTVSGSVNDNGSDSSKNATFYVNDDGHLIMTENGAQIDLGLVRGQDGKDGSAVEKGDKGDKGESGDVAIEKASEKGLLSVVSVLCTFDYTVSNRYHGTTYTREGNQEGAGVIYKDDKEKGDAYIITNYHVVYESTYNNDIVDNIYVYLYGSETMLYYSSNLSYTDQANADDKAIKATFIGGTLTYDIAVLKISDSEVYKSSPAKPVTVRNSDETSAGEPVVVIGNPKNEGIAVTSGVLSRTSEYISMYAADKSSVVTFRVMRTDAAVNSGNSGGGLFDKSGNLIGIVNAKTTSDGVDNMAYAIPTAIAVRCADLIIERNTKQSGIDLPKAGVALIISDCYLEAGADGSLKQIEEVAVESVSEGYPAYGKLQAGDRIVSVTLKGKTTDVTQRYMLFDIMLEARIGNTLTYNIVRNGKTESVDIVLTKYDTVA